MPNTCIYYKNRANLKFLSREHIFPKSIKGMERLERGVVSDEANSFFADNLEFDLMRKSCVAIERLFFDHRKKPSKEKKKKFKFPKLIEDTEIHSRAMGKIAFNVLAKLKGKDFVLRQEFDEFRDWILNGKNNWFHCPLSEEFIFSNDIVPVGAHFCIFTITKDYIVADVCLYNHLRKMFPICKRFDDSFVIPNGYICDFIQQKEMFLLDRILTKFTIK